MADRMVVLIDTDPGTDDAIALLMALSSPERAGIDVLGISTVGGNATLTHTTRNTLRILEYTCRLDLPVAKGAARPLTGTFPYAYDFHGPAGLSVRLPAPKTRPRGQTAIELLKSRIMATAHGKTLAALGPLTNVARLLNTHPEVQDRISRIVAMGGALGVPGNVTPYAEFNFYCDPQSANAVLSSGVPVTLVDLKVCRQASIGRDEFMPLLKGGRGGRLVGRLLAGWFRRNPDAETYDLCDPLAMAVTMEPDILATRPGRVAVETQEAERLGESTLKGREGNVEVAEVVDTKRFFELFYGSLA